MKFDMNFGRGLSSLVWLSMRLLVIVAVSVPSPALTPMPDGRLAAVLGILFGSLSIPFFLRVLDVEDSTKL